MADETFYTKTTIDALLENVVTADPDDGTLPPIVEARLNATIAGAIADADIGGSSIRLDALAAGQRAKAMLTGTESEPARGVTVASTTVLNAASEMSLGSVSLTSADNLATMATPHGLAVGDAVAFGAITPSAGVDSLYRTYFVRTVPTDTTFTFSSDPGGATQSVTADATAVALYRREKALHRHTGLVNDRFRITETRPVQADSANPRYDYIKPDPSIITYAPGTATTTGMRVEIEYEGPKIGVLIRNFAAVVAEIFVDDRFVTTVSASAMTAGGIPANNVGRTTLVFDDARRRSISVRFKGTADFVGFDRTVEHGPICPTGTGKGARALVVGDSFTEGTGSTGGRGYTQWLSLLMGWRDLWKGGSGSTGYVADGNRLALIDRYENDIVAQEAQIVVIAMGINDAQETLSSVVSAAETIWDATLGSPHTQELIIIGPWPNGGGLGAISQSLIDMDAALADLAATKGVRYISPISEGWQYTLSDATHPDTAGHEYIATRLAGHLLVPYIAAT